MNSHHLGKLVFPEILLCDDECTQETHPSPVYFQITEQPRKITAAHTLALGYLHCKGTRSARSEDYPR